MRRPTYHLSERQAWREIARRIAESNRNEYSLCSEKMLLHREGLISEDVSLRMLLRLRCFLPPGHEHFEDEPFAWDRRDRDVRVLAALFLALEAEDEA